MAVRKYKIMEECEAVYNDPDTDDPAEAQALRAEAHAIGEAVHALHSLASQEVRQQLQNFVAQTECGALNLKLGHKSELLNSFHEAYWARTQTDLFFR
eukprot:3094197-Karenia_brevis.AAC.1